jgi:hypothetical protein
MSNFPSKAQVEALRKDYPTGARVELVKMDDPYTKLKAGERGTVHTVDDAGGVHIDWDNGESLAAIPPDDEIKIIPPTDRLCHRCHKPACKSDNPEYRYQCFNCDEDLYRFETHTNPEFKKRLLFCSILKPIAYIERQKEQK